MLGLALIPVLFCTYNGVIGKSPDWINIAIFFIAAAIAYTYETIVFEKNELKCRSKKLAIGVILVIALLFVVFTFRTPEIGMFKDPISGTYGI